MIAAQPASAGDVGAVEAPLVAVELRRDGVAVVRLDDGRKISGPPSPSFGAELAAVVDRIEGDPSIAGAVLTGCRREPGDAGVDVDLLRSIKFASDAERLARDAAQALGRVAGAKKPFVAAVQGPTFGGRFELALACHALVAADEPDTSLGLRDVRLGLVPAANGLLRAARRSGLKVAVDLALDAQPWPARKALEAGLVDEVCPAVLLVDVAVRRAKALAGRSLAAGMLDRRVAGRLVGPRGPRVQRPRASALEATPLGRAVLFAKARDRARAASAGGHYPAPDRVLDVLERYARRGFDAAAELEARCFGEIVVSETAHRLMELASHTSALERRRPAEHDGAGAREPARVGVVGGGLMGGGIAFASLVAGAAVRWKEKDDAAAGRALRRLHDLCDAQVASRRWTPLDRQRLLSRLSVATDYSGLRHADLVVEAVFEDLALKQAVARDLEAVVRPECVLASCTSSIPIASIADGAAAAERFVGMHYFSPVHRVALLEVVRAAKTSARALATAVAFGRRQQKAVIVVRDGPGFYTTRILAPLLNEAAHLVGEGVAVETVDRAMTEWGFPVGPLRLLDEIGVDVAAQVARAMHGALGERMAPPRLLSKLLGDDRRGRKNGRGLYRYGKRPRPARSPRPVDERVYALVEVRPTTILPLEEIQMRCALAMVNEAARCFGEGVIGSAPEADVGAVLGLGFPAFRGGPLRYVDTLGAAEALRRVQGYADRFGERWRPAPLLVHMAKKGERFHS